MCLSISEIGSESHASLTAWQSLSTDVRGVVEHVEPFLVHAKLAQ